jgi:hypothetical protein
MRFGLTIVARWISAAQRTASTTLTNSANEPSPARLAGTDVSNYKTNLDNRGERLSILGSHEQG